MKLVVGCPVRQRSWIITHWFDHVEAAAAAADVTPHYLFVGDPHEDPTIAVIANHCAYLGRAWGLGKTTEPGATDRREWDEGRFAHMVALRNQLLGAVRDFEPDYFLSLDSDILLHPEALTHLFESIERFGAVAGATFMTPQGTYCPNYGWLSGMTGLSRQEPTHVGVIPVGVIMALKLMSPAAYAVDYELHPQGEDIGWSAACARVGVKFGWDNRSVSKHVMSPESLQVVDVRAGW